MTRPVSASVAMFRMPGYPWLCESVQVLLDQAVRVLDDADDPMEMAADLAEVLEVVGQAVRDFGAELLLGRAS